MNGLPVRKPKDGVFTSYALPQNHPIRGVYHAIISLHRAGAIDKGLLNIGPLVAGDVETINRGLTNWAMQVAQPEFIRLRG